MLVRTSLADFCKRCLLRTGIPCALSGASNVEHRLEQELQLHQFLLTQRVTHKVLRTAFPLESKQARAQRNLSSQKLRQGNREIRPPFDHRTSNEVVEKHARELANEDHSESQPKFILYLKSLLYYCGRARGASRGCKLGDIVFMPGRRLRSASSQQVAEVTKYVGCTVASAVAGCGEVNLLECGSFVRGRKRKKGGSIPFILSRRDYVSRLHDECP